MLSLSNAADSPPLDAHYADDTALHQGSTASAFSILSTNAGKISLIAMAPVHIGCFVLIGHFRIRHLCRTRRYKKCADLFHQRTGFLSGFFFTNRAAVSMGEFNGKWEQSSGNRTRD